MDTHVEEEARRLAAAAAAERNSLGCSSWLLRGARVVDVRILGRLEGVLPTYIENLLVYAEKKREEKGRTGLFDMMFRFDLDLELCLVSWNVCTRQNKGEEYMYVQEREMSERVSCPSAKNG